MPFLVCDEPAASENVTYYTVRGLGGGGFADPCTTPATVAATEGFKLDLSSLKPGSYTVKANACNAYQCSLESAPFVFTVPGAPSPPTNLRTIA